jgi:hypothetical protein
MSRRPFSQTCSLDSLIADYYTIKTTPDFFLAIQELEHGISIRPKLLRPFSFVRSQAVWKIRGYN